MRRQITGNLLSFFAIALSISCSGQTNNRFYASFEDYKNDKFIEGYEIADFSWVSNFGGKESIKIINGGKTTRKKLTELPAELYTFDHRLNRTFEGSCNVVLHIGPICLYTWIGDNSGLYYSETITGDIKRFTEKFFEKLLSEHGLLESFKKDNPKREFRDTPSSYYTKIVERNIKYLKLIEAEKKG